MYIFLLPKPPSCSYLFILRGSTENKTVQFVGAKRHLQFAPALPEHPRNLTLLGHHANYYCLLAQYVKSLGPEIAHATDQIRIQPEGRLGNPGATPCRSPAPLRS